MDFRSPAQSPRSFQDIEDNAWLFVVVLVRGSSCWRPVLVKPSLMDAALVKATFSRYVLARRSVDD